MWCKLNHDIMTINDVIMSPERVTDLIFTKRGRFSVLPIQISFFIFHSSPLLRSSKRSAEMSESIIHSGVNRLLYGQ